MFSLLQLHRGPLCWLSLRQTLLMEIPPIPSSLVTAFLHCFGHLLFAGSAELPHGTSGKERMSSGLTAAVEGSRWDRSRPQWRNHLPAGQSHWCEPRCKAHLPPARASPELFTGRVNTMDTMPANAQGLNQSSSNEPCELLQREEGASPPRRAARALSCPWSWTHSAAPCAGPSPCVSSEQTDKYKKYVPINRTRKLVHVQHTCCWWLSTCSWGAAAPIWLLSSHIKSLQESSSSS